MAMEVSVEKIFSKKIIEQAGQFYNVDKETAVKLGDAENYVFEIYRQATPYILRITHETHRTKQQLLSELLWVKYLQKNGAQIPNVLLSIHDNLIETVKGLDGSDFYCCLFEKAPGNRLKNSDKEFNELIFFEWGRTIGQFHRLTKNYRPNQIHKRLEWDEEELLNIEQYYKDAPDEIIQQQNLVIDRLTELPQCNDNYGLIHSDIHHGNFHVHNGSIYVFDFDDCSYHWFASDLAIPLYYYIWSLEQSGITDFEDHGKVFMKELLKGYETENKLSVADYQTIPLFLKLRDITLYSFFHKKFEKDKMDDQLKQIVQSTEDRIYHNRPIIQLDFNEFIIR